MSRFVAVDRQTSYLLPPSVDEWLPDDHLARFVVEVIEQLDLSEITRQYAGRGSAAHHPAVLLALLVCLAAMGLIWLGCLLLRLHLAKLRESCASLEYAHLTGVNNFTRGATAHERP